jgi:hypothetical protein
MGLLCGVAAWCLATLVLARAARDGLAALDGGAATLDQLFGGIAAALGLILLAWTALATVCAIAVTALPAGSAVGRGARQLSDRITPGAVRRVLTLLVGAALVSGAVPAQATTAAAGPSVIALSTDPVPSPGSDLDPGWFTPSRASGHQAADSIDPGWAPPTPRPTAGSTSPVPSAEVGARVATGAVGARRPTAPDLDPTWGSPGRLRAGVDPEASVVIRRGDNLWDLAARHLGPGATDAEIAAAWPRWFTTNRAVIGSDPDLLRPGWRLHPPSSTPGGVA